MSKWSVTASVRGSAYLGEVEAETEEEAKQLAEELAAETHIGLCHQCSDQCEDPEIEETFVDEQT